MHPLTRNGKRIQIGSHVRAAVPNTTLAGSGVVEEIVQPFQDGSRVIAVVVVRNSQGTHRIINRNLKS